MVVGSSGILPYAQKSYSASRIHWLRLGTSKLQFALMVGSAEGNYAPRGKTQALIGAIREPDSLTSPSDSVLL